MYTFNVTAQMRLRSRIWAKRALEPTSKRVGRPALHTVRVSLEKM